MTSLFLIASMVTGAGAGILFTSAIDSVAARAAIAATTWLPSIMLAAVAGLNRTRANK